jgi:hypothetical protein
MDAAALDTGGRGGRVIPPSPRADAPVLWTWRRMMSMTRVVWQR